jgi:hypothetical protein
MIKSCEVVIFIRMTLLAEVNLPPRFVLIDEFPLPDSDRIKSSDCDHGTYQIGEHSVTYHEGQFTISPPDKRSRHKEATPQELQVTPKVWCRFGGFCYSQLGSRNESKSW